MKLRLKFEPLWLWCAATELTGKRGRHYLNILSEIFYPLGYGVCLIVSFVWRDYFVIELIITLPFLLLLSFYLYVLHYYIQYTTLHDYTVLSYYCTLWCSLFILVKRSARASTVVSAGQTMPPRTICVQLALADCSIKGASDGDFELMTDE